MRTLIASFLLLVGTVGIVFAAGKDDYLSDEEEQQLRNAQEPSERIGVYLSIAQTRLDRIDDYRHRAPDPQYDVGGYLDQQFDQYVRVTDELKNWIQDHYDRQNDMREGLRKFLDVGPKKLELLRHIEQTPDPYTPEYRKSLGDAIDDFNDALDGAAKAFSGQSKLYGELKRQDHADAVAAKDRAKEDKKRSKEEKKLRKKEHRKSVPGGEDED